MSLNITINYTKIQVYASKFVTKHTVRSEKIYF